jgi:hypothetical protein
METQRKILGTIGRALLASGFLLVAAPSAFAAPPAPPKPNAAELSRSGETTYEAADHTDALADFTASDAHAPSPESARDIAFASNQDVTTSHPVPAQPVVPPAPPPVAPAQPPPPQPVPLPQLTTVAAPAQGGVSRRTVAFVAAGVAVVGAGLATTFGVLALNNKGDYGNGPTLANADQGNNDAAYADGAIALGVLAGVTSLVLFLTDDPSAASGSSAKSHAAFAASPFFLEHGGGASALVRF